jgi:hypothetical protein
MAEKTITIKKDILWKIGTILFAVLFIISLFTGGFGIGGEAVADGEGTQTILECASDYGLDEDTIIFYYSDSCGWCAKMKPGVQSLIDRGYNVYLANANEGSSLISECVSEYMTTTGVPQFICVKTGEIKIGAGAFIDAESNLDQAAMDAWFESCLAD